LAKPALMKAAILNIEGIEFGSKEENADFKPTK
jgi:hypothetical protein